MVDFGVRTDTSTGKPCLFVTQIRLSTGALDPTIEELKMYNWRSFFACLCSFEQLQTVKFKFSDEARREQIMEEHNRIVPVADRQSFNLVYCQDSDDMHDPW